MQKFIRGIKVKYFRYVSFFYRYLGPRVFIALFLIMMMAVLDGIGLTMFLPLLSAADGSSGAAAEESMGQLSFILDFLRDSGIELTLVNLLLIMLAFFVAKGLARFGADLYSVILQQKFANKMRLTNMEMLAGYDYKAFSQANSGRIQNTFSGEIGRVAQAYTSFFSILRNAVMTMVYVGLAYVANPRFAIIVALGGVLSNVIFNRIYKVTKEASRNITGEMNTFQGFLIQSVTSFKFLKATNLIDRYKHKVNQSVLRLEAEQRRVGTMNALATALREPLIMLIVVTAIILQVSFFGHSLSMIILSLLFFYRGLTSLVGVQNGYNNFLGVSGSIANMENFVTELEQSQESNGELAVTTLNDKIEVNKLSYAYGDKQVLRDLSLTIPRHTTIGFVGESGSGKTTLVNLLCSLLTARPGEILIDGADSTAIDRNSYRNLIGYVTQEPQVFSDTIFNNVCFWEADTPATRQRVREALASAHADDFVGKLPQGLDTVIGINGINLSGGQRQRISIARELYRNVEILVLDEATSALDSQSERLIQENIDELAGDYTMMVIAHRLSTVQNADQIVYLQPDGGYLVGTFQELQLLSAEFRRLVELQSVGLNPQNN